MANSLRVPMEIGNFPDFSLPKEILNRRQCENLLDNFRKGAQAIETIANGSHGNVFRRVEEDMILVVNKARGVIEECCNDDWCRVVVKQMNNKETFRELLEDFECSFHTMCKVFCHLFPNRKAEILMIESSMTFFPTCIDEVEEDRNSMYERFSKHLKMCKSASCKDCRLVEYLRDRVKGLQKAEGGELDSIIFPHDYPPPKHARRRDKLGKGQFGHVYSTKWLDFDTATKFIEVKDPKHEAMVWKEASILGALNHPSIIKLFCCGFTRDHPNIKKLFHCGLMRKNQKMFEIVTERGTMDLLCFLEQQTSFNEESAIDIMLQIASGMCYLHDMDVAHRDLKPQNVVLTSNNSTSVEHVHVKLVDFGISKIEVTSSSKVPTGLYGSPGYTAPEVLEKKSKVDAFKMDVFSFGMMFSEILLRKRNFDRSRNYSDFILNGERPELPEACSEGLKSLIHECWSQEPAKRPTFLDIHKTLRKLKSDAILETFHDVLASKQLDEPTSILGLKLGNTTSLSNIEEQSKNTSSDQMRHEGGYNTKEDSKLIGLIEQMPKLEKLLQHVGSVGFVGIGGIGKSTFADALSDHISHQFYVTVFVNAFTNESCTFAMKYKLENVKTSPKTKTLMEVREILTQLQSTEKILIVADNVTEASQLKGLLGNHEFQDGDGSKLIATAREWKFLEAYVPMVGRVVMEYLDGQQSLELFSMHANFTTNQPCLPYLTYVVKEIVSACGGLPLSLKVMGCSLNGEKRLRIWERKLQRLLRARQDGSDDDKIWNTLRTNFDELNEREKNMFLDISCFFCKDSWIGGMQPTKEAVLRCFDDCDDKIIKQTFERLQDKSLLRVDENGGLDMHDQLRDMGRMIAEKEYQGSRLTNYSSSTFIDYRNRKDTRLIEGLSFTNIEKVLASTTIVQVQGLRLLSVQNCEDVPLLFSILKGTTKLKSLSIHFNIECDDFLVTQHKFNHDMKKIAKSHLQKLSILKIFMGQFSKFLPFDVLHFKTLKELSFIGCETLNEFPNGLQRIVSLEELNIIQCKSLKRIPEGLRGLTCLKKLSIWKCETLEEFPSGVCTLMALEELTFSGCESLKKIPEGLRGLTCLKKLYMWECKDLEEFPFGVCTLVVLEELEFNGCKLLKKIPEGLWGLTCLKKLYMWDCEALEEFPSGVGTLMALEELNFCGCKFLKNIPEGLRGLTCLKKLYMSRCEALEEFPSGVGTLEALEELAFNECKSLKNIPEGLRDLTCLKKLYMWECEALEEFPFGVCTLVALEELEFYGCKSLKNIPEGLRGLTCLKKLYMWDCEALEEFPSGVSTLVALEELKFNGCKSLKKISEGLGGLTCLKKLYMWDCEALEEFPSGVCMLMALEKLGFSGCKSLKKIPEGLGGLAHLRKLHMWDCQALEEFPSGVCTLKALEKLAFNGCKSLKKIPEGIRGLTCLKKLYMWECEALEEFPSGVGTLMVLEELKFRGCKSLKNITEGLGGLTCLKKLDMSDCEALEEFPSGVGMLVMLEELTFDGCISLKKIPEKFVV